MGPPVGSALPSPGSSEASSPASAVLRRCATPGVPLAALRCLRLAIPCGAPVVSLPTQNSLPAAGQALPDGIGYPQGCDERFLTRVVLLSRAYPGARTFWECHSPRVLLPTVTAAQITCFCELVSASDHSRRFGGAP